MTSSGPPDPPSPFPRREGGAGRQIKCLWARSRSRPPFQAPPSRGGKGGGGLGGPLLLLLLLLALGAPAFAQGAPVLSQGTYTDAGGGKHPWTINNAHALIWDGAPFLPVGGVFQARSWAAQATEQDWASDVAALGVLKERGVSDLYVQPAAGGLTGVKPEHIQRLLDQLDALGFTYGISINDAPRDPLIAYEVRPGAYRQAGVRGGTQARFAIPNVGSSLYLAVSAAGDVVDSGEATLVDGGARVNVAPRTGDLVVFLVPERIYVPQNGLGLPNLWDGFDGYRDELLQLFAQVKLGKGFRFFVDPLGRDLALQAAGDRLVPSTTGFQTEWGAWLQRKYGHVDRLHTAWGLPERDLTQIAAAALLVPLWGGGKGIEAFHDRASGKRLKADARRSGFWADLAQFKVESVRGYMNALAGVLKREVADVPVVYRTRGYSPLFSGLPARGGFDGVGIEAYGRGPELVTQSAGYAYAQAAEAPKTLWLPVTGTQDTEAGAKPEIGYPSRATLFGELDWLREIGAKGFYVEGLRLADPARKRFSLLEAPDQLGWLRDYKKMLDVTARFAEHQPSAVFYPRGVAVASLRPLPGGGWWLPTDRPATLYDFGPAGRAYGLETESGTVYYLWNPRGTTRRVQLRLPKRAKGAPPAPDVRVSDPTASERRGILTLTIGPEPVSIRNLPQMPVPLEAFPELADEAEALVALARKQGRVEAALFGEKLAFVRAKYREDNPLPSLRELQEMVDAARTALRPYLWLEAESAAGHSFDEARQHAGAGGGRVLTVGERAPGVPATATYVFDAVEPATYAVWAATTRGAVLTLRVDGQPITADGPPETRGGAYADGLVWTRLGSATVAKGRHTLEVRSDGPSTVDTLLLYRGDFTPDGPNPPPIPLPAPEKKK